MDADRKMQTTMDLLRVQNLVGSIMRRLQRSGRAQRGDYRPTERKRQGGYNRVVSAEVPK